MSLSILSIGTALPETVLTLEDTFGITRGMSYPTEEQFTWVPAMLNGTGIATRYLALPAQMVRDVCDGTRLSGSPFVPSGLPGDRGPTTQERMRHYAELAPPLALAAAAAALAGGGTPAGALTHLVTVS